MKNDDYLEENVAYTIVEEETFNASGKNDFDFEKLMKDFDYDYTKQTSNDFIFAEISNYDLNYNMKQLAVICSYYEIVSNKKGWKKMDYIKAIVEFECNPEYYDTVMRRKQMWFYMSELKNDKFMKQFTLFL